MFEKVVVPINGSALAERIVFEVNRILVRPGTQVALVRVIPLTPGDMDEAPVAVRRALAELGRWRDRLVSDGARVTTHILLGDAAAEIVRFADEWGATLIALSTHGRSGIDRLLSGSVAETVLRTARAPVLVANIHALEAASELVPRRILVPLDGSPLAESILPDALAFARLYESTVVLFHALDMSGCHYPESALPHLLEKAQAMLKDAASRFPGIATERRIVVGNAARSILDAVRDERADLVALATHGNSGVSRLVYGSVAEEVLRHASCPLLVKHPTAAPESVMTPVELERTRVAS